VTRLYGAWVNTDAEPEPGVEPARCSAKGCRAAATVQLTWRNPAIHDGARRKHWLACAEHEAGLADFLDRRRFLLSREPLGPG
jgi:hypothetical protein